MEEDEVATLKDAVYQQQIILQKCQAELEEEREASASAASEALSMILRLQGEKANEKMEACQYKRMAEERMRHAEESLVMFEDLLYQKELEIASLRIQVHECVDKAPGVDTDSNENELKFPVNQILKSTNSLLQDKNSSGLSRRSSLPVLQLQELCSQIDSIDRELYVARSTCPAPRGPGHDGLLNKRSSSVAVDKLTLGNIHCCEQNEAAKKQALDFDASHIRKIQDPVPASISAKVKLHRATTADFCGTRDGYKYFSKKQAGSDKSYPLNDQEMSISSPQQKALQLSLDSDAPATSNSQISRKPGIDFVTSDILGAQQECGTSGSGETRTNESPSATLVEKRRGASPNRIQKDAIDNFKLEDGFKTITPRSNLSTPRNEAAILGFQFPAWNYKNFGASPRSDFEQFERRLQTIEEKMALQQQIPEKETEQLKLIKDIHRQLDEIWDYMKERDSRQDVHGRNNFSKGIQDDESYAMLEETMLSFSI